MKNRDIAYTNKEVRVEASDVYPHTVKVSVGGVGIKVMRATIVLDPNEYNTVTLVCRTDDIDILALQQHTRIVIDDSKSYKIPVSFK